MRTCPLTERRQLSWCNNEKDALNSDLDGGFNDAHDYEDKDEKFEAYHHNKEDFALLEASS